jgi:transposase
MMTQEEYMNVKALHAGGWSIKQIAEHLGFHPATVSSWLKNGGPPPKRTVPVNELVIDERWRARVAQLLAHNSELQGSSVMRVLEAEGYEGSYQSLARYLHSVRGPTRGHVAVTMRIETTPGEEFQFDWSDCNHFARRWGWEHELHCFGCVLSWSRFKHWWFAPSINQPHTFEGLVQFFEATEGVPAVGRTDRMGQLGQSRGKAFIFHPAALVFARHYDFALKACDAGDAKRKAWATDYTSWLVDWEHVVSFLASAVTDVRGRTHPAARRRVAYAPVRQVTPQYLRTCPCAARSGISWPHRAQGIMDVGSGGV